ncbi:MAG: DUF1015 family protein [bacterium]|nr:DUF1015 family protein [bacterium]
MPVIKSFRGLRPRPDLATKVASPPYDVLSSDEARELVKSNPLSFLRVNKPEVDFESTADVYSDEIYARGRENLDRLTSEGSMIRDEKPSLYLYRLTWQGQSQAGLVCLTSVAEYDAGLIKKHEHTRPEKVNDRAHHILTLGAQVGPVFSIFKQNESIRKSFADITRSAPEVDFEADDSVRHQLWVINDDKTIASLTAEFGKLREFYIADGHHRSEAASEVCRRLKEKNESHSGEESYNYFLNVIFPDDELRILPYNRIVRDTNSLSLQEVLEKAGKKFEIAPSPKPLTLSGEHAMGIYSGGGWHVLKARPGTFAESRPAESIDAAILYENLLKPVLGIEDIRTDKRIDFVGGIRGNQELERLVDSGDWQAAFSLAPVTVEKLLAVADASEVMPPKSTWFEPKLRSGMVVSIIED